MSSTSTWKMTQHSISELEKRIKAENESRNTDKIQIDISTVLGTPRQGSGRRPQILGEINRPNGGRNRPPRQLDLPVGMLAQPTVNRDSGETESKLQEIMKMNGILNINGKKYQTDIKDLEHLGELGNGSCGHVVKMLHKPSQTVIAVKQMRRSGNSDENKRIIMDLDVVLKSHDCPFIVQCLGCFITDSDVWICMELMATCFDKLLKRLRKAIPEDMLGKVTYATVKALHYLKESHGVIHRDVKPSNILLDEKGNVKLCDFGISGRLVDSKAKTRSAGCAAYMAPERIDPPDPNEPGYDIRADVWSLGITLVELATGAFPYRDCKTDFEVLTKVLSEDPPNLPSDQSFSTEFNSFVTSCLTKNYKHRPKYRKLLEHPFMRKYETANVNMADWFARAMEQCDINLLATPVKKLTPPPPSPVVPRRHTPLPISHGRSLSETPNKSNGATEFAPAQPTPPLPAFLNHRLENSRLAAADNVRTTPIPQQGFWRVPQPENTWDANKVVGYISPSPPQPPPRRVSESTSVPGSPQHLRVEHFRARFHYTPEPQRRIYEGTDFQDL